MIKKIRTKILELRINYNKKQSSKALERRDKYSDGDEMYIKYERLNRKYVRKYLSLYVKRMKLR